MGNVRTKHVVTENSMNRLRQNEKNENGTSEPEAQNNEITQLEPQGDESLR